MIWLFLTIIIICLGLAGVLYYLHKHYPMKQKELNNFIKGHCLKKLQRENCVTCRTCPFRYFVESSNEDAKILFFNLDQQEKARIKEEKRLAREQKKLEEENG
jgi:hypothetical protein